MTNQGSQTLTSAMKENGSRLLGFIRSRVGSREEAEDIAQEVWYQLSRVIDAEPIVQMTSWLYRVARNKIIDSYRRQKPERLPEIHEGPDDELTMAAESWLSDDENVESGLLRETFWQEFLEALNELPEKQKEVFVMNEMENLTYEEIARRTGENVKTLMSRKRYAVQFLQERLEELYDDFFNQ